MDIENKDIRTNVNSSELQEDLSLWKIIGQKHNVEILKNTVLSYFADKEIKRDVQLPSIILSGLPGLGRRTIARALINSLGITDCRECLGRTVGMGGEATIDVRNIEEDSSFETHTPSTVTAVRGTIYIVNVEGNNGKTDIRETKLIE